MESKSKNLIRVVRIIDRLNIGGPAKHVTWLAAGLNRRDFETLLITGIVPPGEGDMSYFSSAAGVQPLVIKEMSRELGLRDILVTLKVLRALFRFKPQIIHTHKAKAGAVGRLAALIYKWLTPSAVFLRPRACYVVHTYHGHIFHSYYSRNKTRVFLTIERALARFCTDRIITISRQQQIEIHEQFRVGSRQQHEVVSLGIDFTEFGGHRPRRLRRELQLPDDTLLIGIVGRLTEVKNHSMFITAAAGLNKRGSDARFVIIGDGNLRTELEALAVRLGVREKVVFTGFREDATSLYADLDIVALTSLSEGTPLALIEGMSQGCAIASTEVGGVVDLMGVKRDTADGFAVWDHGVTSPTRDCAAFIDAMEFLIQRPQLRREMGDRGRQFVVSHLSKDRLIGDIEFLYRKLLKMGALNENPNSETNEGAIPHIKQSKKVGG